MVKKEEALFVCFGAGGEILIQSLVKVTSAKTEALKIMGAPFIEPEKNSGVVSDMVKAPPGTVSYSLLLRDRQSQTVSAWPLDEVVPCNETAIKLVAQIKWQQLEAEFKSWRVQFKIETPSLHQHLRTLKKLELK